MTNQKQEGQRHVCRCGHNQATDRMSVAKSDGLRHDVYAVAAKSVTRMSQTKSNGQYMTPKAIVDIVLDSVSYTACCPSSHGIRVADSSILSKTIMEPSFGSGAFLVKILERIAKEGAAAGKNKQEIADIIRNNVFGIEKDKSLYDRAIPRLNNFLNSHKLPAIKWDNLVNGDTLKLYKNYQGQMDYVVGNPPFVVVHNLSTEYRELIKNTLRFSSGTMDIYVAFYEIGLSMLNENGKLGYISPNTFLRNASQKAFRDFLIDNGYVSVIYDFKNTRIFDADTYTCVCVLDKSYREEFEVRYNEISIPFSEFKERFRGSAWDLCSKADMEFLDANAKLPLKLGELALIQNGVSTQRDNVYVLNAYVDESCTIPYTGRHTDCERTVFFRDREGKTMAIESKILRRCVKISRFNGEWNGAYILFPYSESTRKEGQKIVPFTEDELKDRFPKAYDYLLSQKELLLKRDRDKHTAWFCFGRSQGLTHLGMKRVVFKPNIKVNTDVVRSTPKGGKTELAAVDPKERHDVAQQRSTGGKVTRVEPHILDEDIVAYGGYYTVCCEGVDLETVSSIIASDDFIRYCRLKGKNMTGGYLFIGSKSVKQFGISRSFCKEITKLFKK